MESTTTTTRTRIAHVAIPPDHLGESLISITDDKGTLRLYWCLPIPTQLDGKAYRLIPFAGTEADAYHTHTGADASCTCKGWQFRQKCKHVAALSALEQVGSI
jgi:hypothetical protein